MLPWKGVNSNRAELSLILCWWVNIVALEGGKFNRTESKQDQSHLNPKWFEQKIVRSQNNQLELRSIELENNNVEEGKQ